MLHKPTARKLPKKYDNSQKEQEQIVNKLASKPAMNLGSNRAHSNNGPHVRGKIDSLEKKVSKVVGNLNNAQLQQLLIGEIKDIKNELKEIKQQIGMSGGKPPLQVRYEQAPRQHSYQNEEEVGSEEEENVYSMGQKQPEEQTRQRSEVEEHPYRVEESSYQLVRHPKVLMEAGKIQPYMKEFKMEVTKQLLPLYSGYHKKSSKPVVIKYCPEDQSLEPLFNLYEKLWKNIVKAKQICINKVYDLHQPLATYILVIEANKMTLPQILACRAFRLSDILLAVLKGLQFFHDCGYLYRNVHPDHVMSTYDNQIVLLDLKRVRRFVDMKGKHILVSRDDKEPDDEFISNSRIRAVKEGRKDDLESLGYLALFALDGQLPWNVHNMPQVRSKLTLKQLCGQHRPLLEYMIAVSQMATEDVPDYASLAAYLQELS